MHVGFLLAFIFLGQQAPGYQNKGVQAKLVDCRVHGHADDSAIVRAIAL